MGIVIRSLSWVVASCLVAASAAAQDAQMVKSTRTEAVPDAGKALVIFVRHSFVMGAYQAPVMDVDLKNPDPKPGQLPVEDKVIGILSGYSKVAYQAEPGEHTFMTVPASGGTALVAKAKLQAGKTYYFLVKPIWGFSPAYALIPARQDPKAEVRVDSTELAGWLKGTEFYEPTPLAEGWLNGNRPSILTKKAEALAKWTALPEDEKNKLTLLETDGK
jgi:hypothetical protein